MWTCIIFCVNFRTSHTNTSVYSVLRIRCFFLTRIRDPDPEWKKIQIQTLVKILKFFDADPDPGYGILSTLNPRPGMEKVGSGIRDKHPGSTTVCIL
jgi:hypothetical protein